MSHPSDRPLMIVSSDAHIGPRLVEDLRPLCPAELLTAFDAYAADTGRSKGRYVEHDASNDDELSPWRNQWADGHHDPQARRRDMDREGIVAEVIFHGSQNDQPVPFQTTMLGPPEDPELYAAGIHLYNRWLAETCAAATDRHIGLAHLPMWDIEAATAELRWAAEAGLRGVNFPAPRPWLRPYNDRAWEPFWTAAEELRMPLNTHAGAGDPAVFQGPELIALMSIESGGWFSRRAAHLMIFGGVFERHPELKLVLTEQPGEWWPYMEKELDTVHQAQASNGPLARQVPKRPSEYLHRNVFVGASFLSRDEAHGAVRDGYADRIMWGSDYPHMESTWQVGETNYSQLSLRFSLSGLAEEQVRAFVGETAAKLYGLDVTALRSIAERINAPTYEAISQPLDTVPAGASSFAFRTAGPWA